MTLAFAKLAGGSLSNVAETTLYTVPSGKTISCRVILVNTSTSTVEVNLYADGIRILPKDMALKGGYSKHSPTFELGAGDIIAGDGTSSVTYKITGILRG